MSDATDSTLIGALIDGRYRVEREIGAGGFGTVYAAFHVGLGAHVALKVLNLPDRLKPERLAQLVGGFLDEARTLKRLRHPNVVAALDVGLLPPDREGRQLPYLVMEWCSGPTLRQHLEGLGGRRMSTAEAWRLFEPMLGAIAHAHAAGVAHRDLKPGNVLLERDGDGHLVARVIDFGIAKIVAPDEAPGSGSTNTASGGSPFTPRYAAPEQLAGARTGPWTDVHALALLFVEMVTGEPAIGSDGDAMLAVFDPVRPTPKACGVDVGALEPVLARALALKPADRYPDAGAFARAMREVADANWPAAPVPSAAIVVMPTAIDPVDASPGTDRTAPPSSHTLRTAGVTTAPRRSLRPRRSRLLVAGLVVAPLVLAGAAGVQRFSSGGWPFRPRLRDISVAELARRAGRAGLGTCIDTESPHGFVTVCERGVVSLTRIGIPFVTLPAIRAHVNEVAIAQSRAHGAAKYAIDDNLALVVIAGPADVAGAFDTVVADARADVRADAVPAPVPERSPASFERLDAWTNDDLAAAVRATGETVTYTNAASSPAYVMVATGPDQGAVTIYLHGGDVEKQLAILRSPSSTGVYAYAIDGDSLLVAKGDPALASADFIRRLLAGAHAEQIGEHPTR